MPTRSLLIGFQLSFETMYDSKSVERVRTIIEIVAQEYIYDTKHKIQNETSRIVVVAAEFARHGALFFFFSLSIKSIYFVLFLRILIIHLLYALLLYWVSSTINLVQNESFDWFFAFFFVIYLNAKPHEVISFKTKQKMRSCVIKWSLDIYGVPSKTF